jgi:hypothetical protein
MDLHGKFLFQSCNCIPYLRTRTYHKVGFEALTLVFMDVTIFWDIAPAARLLFYRLFSTLKMEMISSSETSVHIPTTRRYIPEDGNIRLS